MCIGEGRINLNSSCVALECSIDVLHFFKGVSHVAVCISEVWVYPMLHTDRHTHSKSVNISQRYFHSFQLASAPLPIITSQLLTSRVQLPNGLLVVHQSLLQLALQLQDACQVRVGCSKLRHDLSMR